MKEVDFDVIIPEDEPTVTPLEADDTADDVSVVEANTATLDNEEEAIAEEDGDADSTASKEREGQKEASEVRAQTWRQWIIDDDVKFNKKMLLDLLQGISLLSFLKRNWAFVLTIVVFLMIYVSLGYHHRNLMIENDKLNRELLDRRYKALTRSSELRERTLGSKIEDQLKDSTLHSSTDAPFELPVTPEE